MPRGHGYYTGMVLAPRPVDAWKTVTLSAEGTTEIIPASEGQEYIITYVEYSNGGESTSTVSLKIGAGDSFLTNYVRSGGTIAKNLMGTEIITTINTALNGNLAASGTVVVTVGYLVIQVTGG